MHEKRNYLYYGVVVTWIITIILAIILYVEYAYFKREVQELEQVKESYYQHVDMLKRSINASMVTTDENDDNFNNSVSVQSEQKKK